LAPLADQLWRGSKFGFVSDFQRQARQSSREIARYLPCRCFVSVQKVASQDADQHFGCGALEAAQINSMSARRCWRQQSLCWCSAAYPWWGQGATWQYAIEALYRLQLSMKRGPFTHAQVINVQCIAGAAEISEPLRGAAQAHAGPCMAYELAEASRIAQCPIHAP
jgi:hypothetical protein